MKRSLHIALSAALILVTAHAHAEARGELKPVMTAMGEQFKILGLALIRKQPTPKESVLAAANTLVTLIDEAAKKAPPQLLTPAGEVRPGAEAELAQFDEMIAHLSGDVKLMQQALLSDDQTAAAQIFKEKIMPDQKQGHEHYKNN